MGTGVIVNLNTFGAGYVFKKGDIKNKIGQPNMSTFLHDYTTYIDQNNHAFRLTNNIIEWDDYVITQKDINRGYFILGKDAHGKDQKVSWEKFDYKVGDMLENTTWIIPELQQRNHALTGGFHGVELAATAYAIKHRDRLNFESDFKTYLLHRFGDVYAHFSIEQEAGFDPTTGLDHYIGMLEIFLDQHLDNIKPNIRTDGTVYYISNQRVQLTEEGVYRIGDVFVSTYSREETKKIIIRSLLTAKSEIKRYTPMTDDELENLVDLIMMHRDPIEYTKERLDRTGMWEAVGELYLLKLLKSPTAFAITTGAELLAYRISVREQKKLLREYFGNYYSAYENNAFFLKVLSTIEHSSKQDGNVMYGDEVTCTSNWTSGHMQDGGEPDDILRRSDWFMYYVKHVTELYPFITKNADPGKAPEAIEKIKAVVDWGVQYYNYIGDKKILGWKLDAIFRFLIQLERNKGANEFICDIPIKSLPEEINTDLAKVYYTVDKIFLSRSLSLSGAFEKKAGNLGYVLGLYVPSKHTQYLLKYIGKTEKDIFFKCTKTNYRSAKY